VRQFRVSEANACTCDLSERYVTSANLINLLAYTLTTCFGNLMHAVWQVRAREVTWLGLVIREAMTSSGFGIIKALCVVVVLLSCHRTTTG